MTIFGEGRGKQDEPESEPLSQIVDELNERFGLNLDEQDNSLRPVRGDLGGRPRGGRSGPNNTLENFRLVFDRSS